MYEYKAKVLRVIDGDTIDVQIDLGFNVFTKKRLRFARINAYETRTRNLEEKKLGLMAKELVKSEIEKAGGTVQLQVLKKGKYGRWISEIICDDVNLSDYLVSLELAKFVDY